MHLLGQCHGTFVTELVPFSLRAVTARAPHEADRKSKTPQDSFHRCPSVCGRLHLIADPQHW